MVSVQQTAVAVVILLSIGWLCFWLRRKGRIETERRKTLPIEEQKRIEEADATWSQTLGF